MTAHCARRGEIGALLQRSRGRGARRFRCRSRNRELACRGRQLGFRLVVVLDDAVVDHRDAAARHVRVGVGLGDAAVRGPARVRDADRALERVAIQALSRSHANLMVAHKAVLVGNCGSAMLFNNPYPYQLYEMAHAALAPARAVSDAAHFLFRNPWNPLSRRPSGKNISAGAEMFERMTRRYGKPTFGLDEITSTASRNPVLEEVVWARPFCNLLRFARPDFRRARAHQPKLLIVAPMSGHYATLLRGTVEAFLPTFRRLHHRLGRRAHGSAGARPLRPRRLHRLSARDAGSSRPGRAHDRGLPAVGAAARRGRADGGRRRPATPPPA